MKHMNQIVTFPTILTKTNWIQLGPRAVTVEGIQRPAILTFPVH